MRARQKRLVRDTLGYLIQDLLGRQSPPHAGVGDHAADALRTAIAPGWIGGNGNRPRVQTAKEGGNEIQPLRVHEQYGLTDRTLRLQPGRHGSCAPIQIRVRPGFLA